MRFLAGIDAVGEWSRSKDWDDGLKRTAFRSVGPTPCRTLLNCKSLAQCLGFYPMTLAAVSADVLRGGIPTPCLALQVQRQVIGTMFGFLPRNLGQPVP